MQINFTKQKTFEMQFWKQAGETEDENCSFHIF